MNIYQGHYSHSHSPHQQYNFTLQDTEVTSLSESSPTQQQPESITINLFKHQLSLLTQMQTLERTNQIQSNNSNIILDTNVGVISDKVGSGKTLASVALVCENCPPQKGFRIIEGHPFTSIKRRMPPSNGITLVIVPHSLTQQWSDAFHLGRCERLVVKREAHIEPGLDRLFQVQNDKPKVAIVNANFALKFQHFAWKRRYLNSGLYWSRIIIDEAHQVKLHTNVRLYAHFIWLITATPKSLRFAKSQIIRNNIGHHLSNSLLKMVIKNQDNYVDASIQLPDVKHLYYRCFTPPEYIALESEISSDVMSLLHSGNVEQALLKLNCNIDTQDNIYSIVTNRLQKKLHNAEKHLEYLNTIQPENLELHTQHLEKAEKEIASLQTRCDTIKQNIYQLNTQLCPVCYSDFKTPVLAPCCCNTFCLECLVKSLQMSSQKCPFCREQISLSDLHSIQNSPESVKPVIGQDKPHTKDKIEQLLGLASDMYTCPNKRMLVFSCYDLSNIKQVLTEKKIIHQELCGSADHIQKVLESYRKGETRIILLSANHYGSGLNLEITSDIIVYHKLGDDLQSQVVGRAQRVGRTQPLKVHHLLHHNE